MPVATKILQHWGLSRLFSYFARGIEWYVDRFLLTNSLTEFMHSIQYLEGETGQQLIALADYFLDSFKINALAEFVTLPVSQIMADLYYPLILILVQDFELRAAVYELARREGVTFHFNTRAVDVDCTSGSVILADGGQLSADIILGADGFYGLIRKCVVENEDDRAEESIGTPKTALISVSLPLETILADETLRTLSDPSVVRVSLCSSLSCSAICSGRCG